VSGLVSQLAHLQAENLRLKAQFAGTPLPPPHRVYRAPHTTGTVSAMMKVRSAVAVWCRSLGLSLA